MIFENNQIDLQQLPILESTPFHQLDRNHLTSEYIATLIFYGFLFVGLCIFTAFMGWQWWVFALWGGWLTLMGFSLFLVYKNFQIAGYAMRQRDIAYRRGVLWRSLTTIPFNRMQHCEIVEGPVEKLFELATLKIYTAGGSDSDLSISGLRREEASRIKDFITRKIGTSDEEE